MKLVHCSDLHFGWPGIELDDPFSKRLLGTLNLLLARRGAFSEAQAYSALEEWKRLGATHILVTGDLTTTGARAEYAQAKAFLDALKREGWPVYVIPGNHDIYTKKVEREGRFSQTLCSPEDLSVHDLDRDIRLILLNTACATPWHLSTGLFSPLIEQALQRCLEESRDKRVILANHFPLFPFESPRRTLRRSDALLSLLKSFPQVEFYLHGHTHRPILADLSSSGLPLVADSGSLTLKKRGGFNVLDLSGPKWRLEQYACENGLWKKSGTRVESDLSAPVAENVALESPDMYG